MKKLLYIAFKDMSFHHHGVNKKIINQCKVFKNEGYMVDLVARYQGNTIIYHDSTSFQKLTDKRKILKSKYFRSVVDKSLQIKCLINFLKRNSYDVCYIRYDLSSPGFIRLLRCLKKVCNKIIIEFPTYPYEQEYGNSIKYLPKMFLDKKYRGEMKKYVDRIITFYNNGDYIYGIPTIKIPNGFDFSGINIVKSEQSESEIRILAISTMRNWHGYERFIQGLYNYYKNGGDQNIILHLGGTGPEYEKYNTLTQKYKLDKHVKFEGPIYGEKLDLLFEKCQIGIDSLARHRSNISILSSLKSREYGAKGIPFINSCKIDIVEDDFPYILRVPETEDPIDMKMVLDFYNSIFRQNKSRVEVAKEIREYFEKKVDMSSTLKPILNYLDS